MQRLFQTSLGRGIPQENFPVNTEEQLTCFLDYIWQFYTSPKVNYMHHRQLQFDTVHNERICYEVTGSEVKRSEEC